jgi:hypothetical protein
MAEAWPPLPYEAWKDTYATLHMSTPVLAHGVRTFTMRFDFVSHELVIETSDGDARVLPLVPRSVAAFYADTRATLRAMGLPVRMWPMPVEIPDPVRFDQDEVHHAYDRQAVQRFWRILLQVHRVFLESRCSFVGKCSPVHFFWGSFDLAVTRFSGRRAPDRDGPAFMREAYSHEVISHGFWPGSPPVLEPAFYTYAVPTPSGLAEAAVRPEAAYYHRELGEFLLPYEAVRRTPDPKVAIREFVDSTYAAAADLAGWDRATLEA